MTTDLAIRTKGLTKMYKDTLAVNGLDLEVKRGSVFGFLGLNGAGKTTTIKMLLNLVYPTSGEATVLGYDIVTQSLQVRERTGYVGEEPVIYDYMKVSEVVNFCRGVYNNWDMKMAGKYLELFELPVGKKVKALSKGMKNQLALAVALGSRPDLLILDEPTAGLDPVKTRDFYGVILEQVAETGQTVFFSSHNLYEVERVADTVGIIHRGSLVFNRSLDDIKTHMKKIRVVFNEETPIISIDNYPGVSSLTQQGRGMLLQCEKDPETVLVRLRELNPADIEVIDMTLEDVFIQYTGGEKSGS